MVMNGNEERLNGGGYFRSDGCEARREDWRCENFLILFVALICCQRSYQRSNSNVVSIPAGQIHWLHFVANLWR